MVTGLNILKNAVKKTGTISTVWQVKHSRMLLSNLS
jgi:hypothetical protein